jgi:hypothetical protein
MFNSSFEKGDLSRSFTGSILYEWFWRKRDLRISNMELKFCLEKNILSILFILIEINKFL